MVVVSHLFLSLRKSFRGRFDSCESNLPLFGTIYFPTAPFLYVKIICYKNVSYFQPIFLIPAKTDYIIGCKSDTNIDEKDR